MGISLLSSKTRTRMDLTQHSPWKEMEISAARVNDVPQESRGLSEFHSPPPQSQGSVQAAQMTEHHNQQSTVEPEHSRQAHAHNSPSLTPSALPGVNSSGKEIPPCATTPSSCQEQRSIRSPVTKTAWPPEERSAELRYLTQILYLRVHVKFYFQFPTFLWLTLYQRNMVF